MTTELITMERKNVEMVRGTLYIKHLSQDQVTVDSAIVGEILFATNTGNVVTGTDWNNDGHYTVKIDILCDMKTWKKLKNNREIHLVASSEKKVA